LRYKETRMKRDCKTRRSQDGIALLIAIFVLLLISVVAIALLVSSGTETALGANYRTSSSVYYAALAGLEEARGRLLPRNPNYFGNSVVPPNLPLSHTIYVTNSLSGETIHPWDQSNSFYDKEYKTEFGVEASAVSSWQSVPSIWDNNSQTVPGPIFKWVRINAASEQSLFLQVNSSGYSTSPAIYFDPFHLNSSGNPWPSLVVGPTGTSVQALEITAMASLPTGSKKILQYLVAPVSVNLNFPAALTLDGYSDVFNSPDHSAWVAQGNSDGGDSACSPSGPISYPAYAVAVPDFADVNNVKGGIPTSPNESPSFTGMGGFTPNVAQVTLATSLQTVQGLNQLSQTIIQNADAVIAGPATEANLPSAMSSANPMTVAVQGDFTFGAASTPTGYGLLLVTGNFTYASGANWNGIVLVIGKGTMTTSENGSGGTFSGATLIAQTLDSSGNLLVGPHPGPATFNDTLAGSVGRGFVYNCGWIQQAQAPLTYKVLSFHEIRQ
jgi:hypothetical protein